MLAPAALAAILILAGPAIQDDTASLDAAHGLLARGHHELAEAEYRAFLESDPDATLAATAWYGLGVCLFRQDDHVAAIEVLERIPRDRFAFAAEVGTMLGRAHLTLENNDEAIQHLRRVVDRHGDHDLADDAGAMYVEALYAKGASEEALTAADAFAERWPDSPLLPRTGEVAARCEMDLGRDQAAARRLARLTRRGGGTPLLLAQACHRAGDTKGAETAYRQAATTDGPDAAAASAGLAQLLHETGRFAAAKKQLDTHVDRYPDDATTPGAKILRGRCLLDQGAADEAAAYFARLAKRRGVPRDETEYWRARSVLAAGDAEAAARLFAAAVTTHAKSPLAPELRHDHAVALLRLGQPKAALRTLADARTLAPQHHLAIAIPFLMAQAEHQAALYDESKTRCQKLLRGDLAEWRPAVAFLLVENTYLGGDARAAGRGYATFIENHPDAPERPLAELRLGLVLAELGEADAARPWLERSAGRPGETFAVAHRTLADIALSAEAWTDARGHYAAYLDTKPAPDAARDARFRLAVATQRAGALAEANEIFSGILSTDPKHPEIAQVVYELGVIAQSSGDEETATTHFQRVVRRHGDSPHAARAAFALALLAAGDGDEAASARLFADAATRSGDASIAGEATFQQGQMLFSSEQYAEAALAFALVVEQWPTSPRAGEAAARHAIALARAGNDEALRHLRRAEQRTELDPALRAAVTYELAWLLREAGRTDEARKAYERLLEHDGVVVQADHARIELADLALAEGDHAAAAAWLQPLLERTEQPEVRHGALYRLGVCAYEQGEHSAAASHLETYVDEVGTGPLVAPARLLAGESLFALGTYRRVVEILEPMTRTPDDIDAETLDAALIRLGDATAVLQLWPRSESAYDEHLRRFPTSDRAYQARFGRGWARENQGRTRDAVTDYEAVIDAHGGPTAARAQFQIGECLFAEEKPADAVRAFLKVDILYAYPEWSAAALYEAGRCFEAMNDRAEARRHFEQVVAEHGATSWSDMAAARLSALGETDLPGRSEKRE